MKIPLKHTRSEEAIISLLEKNGSKASHIVEKFRDSGLPTRKVEAWHYTDLRNLLKNYPELASGKNIENITRIALEEISNQFSGIVLLPIIDGKYRSELAKRELPKKVLLSLCQHKSVGVESIHPEDVIDLLNSGLANEGLTVAIRKNVKVPEIICLANILVNEGSCALRHSVNIGAGASAVFMESYISAIKKSVLDNSICNLELEEGASCIWVIDQKMSDKATRLGQLNVRLSKNASLTILSLNSGCKLSRQEINIKITGERASLKIRGVNLVNGGSHIDVTTRIDHLAPDSVSSETFRNVVPDNGHGVFQGQINVAQAAQRTDARMACNSLLLGNSSQFSTKPGLEIFADDVQCAHGATVTDIDESRLFYLMARGIPEKQSRELLIKAFVEEIFDGMEVNQQVIKSLNARIDHWLSKRI